LHGPDVVNDCWFCHGSQGSRSPGEPQAGGREFDATEVGLGFGFLYGSNITADPETGIGAWSDGELVRAIREGLNREGCLIFPTMEAEQMADLVAFMRTW
jgi:hypothetical protein